MLTSSVAAAQTERTGFSFVAGVGAGTFEFTRDDLTDRRVVSQALMVRIGYAHSQHVTLGFELDHWSDGAQIRPSFTWYNAVLLGYPFVRGPLAGVYAKGLFGINHYKNRVFRTDEIGWGAGLGYERAIVKNVAIAAYGDYIVARTSDVSSHMILENGDVLPLNTRTGGKMLVYGIGLRLR